MSDNIKTQLEKLDISGDLLSTEYFHAECYFCCCFNSKTNTVLVCFDSGDLDSNTKNVVQFLSRFRGNLIRCASESDCYNLVRQEIDAEKIILTEFGSNEKRTIPFHGSIREYFLKMVLDCTFCAYTFWLEFSLEEKLEIHETLLKHFCTHYKIRSTETLTLTTDYVAILTQTLAAGRVSISMIESKTHMGRLIL